METARQARTAADETDEKKKILAGVRRIVTHPGLAHVDDILSCALAYAFGVQHDAVIERRRASAADLDDPETLVLDVGLVHDPARLDFDHHQRARDEAPKCTFVLFAEWLGVDGEMRRLFPWFEMWNAIDTLGPSATAAGIGTTAEAIAGLVAHPLADWVVRHFADDPQFRAKVALGLGKEIDKTRRCWTLLNEKARVVEFAGLAAGDLRDCGADEISRCSDSWIRLRRVACLISNDGRGTGLTFLRCHDDPRLDFSRCAGKPYTLFAHPGGFILKTRSRADDPAAVLRDARGEEA
jgi:hypothetical protein